MEDDWSSGYSGYSIDTPLFISSLVQEAQGEWQKVNPKKAAKQSNCSAHAACQDTFPRVATMSSRTATTTPTTSTFP